jgi:hypothetical protein
MDSALHQLQARLDAQGFEARAADGELIVLTPASDDGAPRFADVVTCLPRPDDEGRAWLYVNGRPLEEATHIVDAAVRIGGRLMTAGAGR